MKLLIALATFVGSLAVGILSPVGTALAAPCPDSNGSAPGGSVYVSATIIHSGQPFYCDVSPPQRLHETQSPSAAHCGLDGGHGWTAANRICWDIDY